MTALALEHIKPVQETFRTRLARNVKAELTTASMMTSHDERNAVMDVYGTGLLSPFEGRAH